MRIDANRQSLEAQQISSDKLLSSASDASRAGKAGSNLVESRPDLRLRVEALLKVLPDEPAIRTDRVRAVATRLADGGYVTELAAAKTSAAILGTGTRSATDSET